MAIVSSSVAAGVAAVGAAAAVAGTVSSVQQGRQASKQRERAAAESRRAQAAQRRAQNLRAARDRRETIQRARLARATTIQAGVSSGGGLDSSRTQGAVGSVTSQGAANVSFLDTQQGLTNTANSALVNASIFESKSNRFASNASSAGAVANLGATIFSASGGFSAFNKETEQPA